MDINPSSLFNSKTIVLHNNRIIVSTDLFLYILDSDTGSTLFKIAITSILKPIVSGENLFLVTKDNLLVCININSFKIEYSIDLAQKIADFLEIKNKKFIDIKSLVLVNNDLLLFLNNSYFVKLSLFGDIKKIEKLSSKINSDPIFVDGSLIYIDNKNKLFIKN